MSASPRNADTRRQPPWWLIACAAAYVGYAALLLWCEIDRPEPPGLIVRFDREQMVTLGVTPDSPAARAGLIAGDILIAANGHPLQSRLDWLLAAANFDTDRPIALRVQRHATSVDRDVDATLVLPRARNRYWLGFEGLTHAAVRIAQLITLAVGLIVAFKRPRDVVAVAGAWLLATVGVFSVDLPYGMAIAWRSLPAPIGWALWPPYLSTLAVAAVMWTFFALFPKPLFRSHTRGYLALAWVPMLVTLVWHARFAAVMLHAPEQELAWSWWAPALLVVTAFYVIATLATLVTGYRRLTDVTERRRVRVLVMGMLTGLVSGLPIVLFFWSRSGVDLTHSLFGSPLFAIGTVLLLACPASFAYAILRHRLFDAGMVIRQGVQYALARQVLLSLVPALAALLALDLLLHSDRSVGEVLQARGWIYGGIAIVALLARFRRRAWLDRLDRHFFRERYDAQRLLHDVAHRSREAAGLGDIAPHVIASIERALHPACAAILIRPPQATMFETVASSGCDAVTLPSDGTALGLLRLLKKPLNLDPDEGGPLTRDLPAAERALLASVPIELLVPIAMHHPQQGAHERTGERRREALIALGPRRSEEPFSQEDHELLGAVADSLAMVLDRGAPTSGGASAPAATAVIAASPSRPRDSDGNSSDGNSSDRDSNDGDSNDDSKSDIDRDAHTQAPVHVRECPECGTCYDANVDRCAADDTATIVLTLPRRLADRYRLDRRIARGGMGTVYDAFDQMLDRRVAAKVLRPELLHSIDAAKRFEREARLAAGLSHPHIVTVHDFGVTATGSGFLVMERLEGVTLRARLARGLQLAPEDALRVLRGVASAIEFAHQRQLVHRDLKPENIFLVRGHDALTMDAPKVLDFGLARALAPPQSPTDSSSTFTSESADRLTQSGMLVGTLPYMSPEQLRGETATAAWDLWSLALIAYEMLTGTLPFSGHLGGAAAAGHEAAIAAPLAGALAGARETFVRALALDVDARYPSASALVDALQRALHDEDDAQADARRTRASRVAPASSIDSEP